LNNNQPWRAKVGGLWEQLGKLQFEYLVKNGLKSHHFLLDIGSGSLRGGIHFIRYLENGHYFGIDKDFQLLESGKIELEENNLLDKKPVLKLDDDFDFVSLNQKFEYALAQSVFTHLHLSEIKKCIENVEKVLVDEGKFYATFHEDYRKDDTDEPMIRKSDDGFIIETYPGRDSYPDKDSYHYRFFEFEKLVKNTSLSIKYIGDWNHPRHQKIMVFSKSIE